MIDPRSVFVGIPCYSGSMVAELCGVLIATSRMYGRVSIKQSVSHISLARNMIAEQFKQSGLEWLLTIDDDIAPRPEDMELILGTAPVDYFHEVGEGPTRVSCPLLEQGSRVMGSADAIVCAEYSYKDDLLRPVHLGLGFTRIHRSVFEALDNLKHTDDGSPRLWQFTHEGKLLVDYYPSGPLTAMLVPGAPWTGEDHGFFMVCKLAGIVPRIETRTRLHHIGRKAYPYIGDPQNYGAQ